MRVLRTTLTAAVLVLAVLIGSAGDALAAENLFTTIGITRPETRMNSEINGNPPYSLPADEMPASRIVTIPENDTADDVPLRMPDTSGEVPNLAEFRGQTLELDPADQKPFSTLHFFGTTADGSGGGTFVLTYEDDTTAEVEVEFGDWCAPAAGDAHIAIGRMSKRYRAAEGGQDGAQCSIFHVERASPVTDKKLVSVKLPPETDGSGSDTRAYLMALTLEEPSGSFELPNLTGVNEFPDDDTAPASELTVDPAEPSESGWYTERPLITIDAADEDGGSGVEQVLYRVNGGPSQLYSEPFELTAEGELELEYRAIDRAGNAEPYKAVQLKVDATAPTTTATTYPRESAGWHDREVTVSLRAGDGVGSGTATTSYRINDGAWTTYDGPFQVAQAGTNVVRYRSTDAAGNVEDAQQLSVRVDVTAPTTTVRLNGGEPLADYTGAVRVTFTRDDGAGSGVRSTEYRVDGGAWTPYTGAVDVTGERGHKVDYRSVDVVGNVENFKSVVFAIHPPALLPSPLPQALPAAAHKAFAALEEVASRRRTLAALRGGRLRVNVSCVGVRRGTLTLTVERATARRLKLKRRTLARKVVRCGADGRATVTVRPSAAVRRALKRSKRSVTATLRLRMTGAATDTQEVTFRGKS